MTPTDWFYNGAEPILRTVVVGVAAYAVLVAVLRVSGKRTLSKFNAFDFVVTVALGSTLASILVSSGTALAQGVAAFVVLVALQALVAWLSTRSGRLEALVKSTPRLLVYQGRLLEDAMREERISDEEVHAAARQAGLARLDDAEAIILEANGQMTCVHRTTPGAAPP